MRAYIVSLLKAWWGDAATAENDFCFDYLPRITGDHSHYQTTSGACSTARCKGFFVMGENPAVGSANARLQRLALANLDWLVVRDFSGDRDARRSGTTRPRSRRGELRDRGHRAPRCSSCPPPRTPRRTAASRTRSGCCSGTTRPSSPPATAARELWFMLPPRPRSSARSSPARPTRATDPSSTSRGTTRRTGEIDEPDAEAVLARDQRLGRRRRAAVVLHGAEGRRLDRVRLLDLLRLLRRRRQPDRPAQGPGREQGWVAPEWGWAWPANRRILYNRASADPDGSPWSRAQALRVVGRTSSGSGPATTSPDFKADKAPDYDAARRRRGRRRARGDDPFIMQADGKAWLFAPTGLVDGPLPTHYEPQESPFPNPLYGAAAQPGAPARLRARHNRYNPTPATRGDGVPVRADDLPADRAPHRRRHEPLRAVPLRAPAGAVLRGQPRARRRARARARRLGDDRHRSQRDRGARARDRSHDAARRAGPDRAPGRRCRTTGAAGGLTTGDSANDLFALVLDPNVHIQEVKAATCDIRPGRRPRGRQLRACVERYRRRAGITEERP